MEKQGRQNGLLIRPMNGKTDIQALAEMAKQNCQSPRPDVREPWWVDTESDLQGA